MHIKMYIPLAFVLAVSKADFHCYFGMAKVLKLKT